MALYASGTGTIKFCFYDGCEKTFEVDSKTAVKLSFRFVSQKLEEEAPLRVECISGKVSVYSVSLLPADHFHNMRRDVVELLKSIAPAQLRFPGGCFADHYDWKESLKEPDLRTPIDGTEKPFLLRNTYHQDCFEISVDDFMALCKYVGAIPELTVRMVNADMQEAVDLLEYCNGGGDTKWGSVREERGHGAYNVKEWYVGNEIYSFGHELTKDGKYAAEETNRYITAMKAVDPDIVTAATCYTELPNWNDDYVKGTDAFADRYSYHYYLTCEFRKDWKNTPKDMVLGVVENGLLPGLIKTCELIDSLPNKDAHTVSFDEWNYAWGVNGSTEMMICNALVFNFLCRDADKYNVGKSLFFHPINEGMIAVQKDGAYLDTTGEAMKLYMSHRGAERLCVEAQSNGEYPVDMAASQKNGKVFMTAINKNTDNAQTVCIKGPELAGRKVTVTAIVPDKFGFDCDTFKWENAVLEHDGSCIIYEIPPAAIAAISVE